MSEHDAKIAEAVARYFDANPNTPECGLAWFAIQAAHKAKREAETPKLLTAEEAMKLWRHTPGNPLDGWQNVLTACLERAALVADRALYAYGWESARPIVRRALTGKD